MKYQSTIGRKENDMNYPYFNNYQYPNYQQTYPQQPQQNTDDRIFVQGELSAQAYLVAPNGFVRLWDSQTNRFYEKRADASGRPYMETFEYKKVTNEQPKQNNYDSRFDDFEKRLSALEKGVMSNVPESNSNDSTVQSI